MESIKRTFFDQTNLRFVTRYDTMSPEDPIYQEMATIRSGTTKYDLTLNLLNDMACDQDFPFSVLI
jgi:hypothetical protein